MLEEALSALLVEPHRERLADGRFRDAGGMGIIATQRGFQGGARKFAEEYCISLVQVRPPKTPTGSA